MASISAAAEWTPLLDRELSKWGTYQSFRHRDGYNGQHPLDASGQPEQPIGYDQNVANVFSTIEENGSVILRISGEIYGCVFTKEEFSNYRVRLKVRWGETKWSPRKELLRDSGLLYHSVGPAGVDYWRSWMLSQEFQIMEGHMGDYWPIANAVIDIRAFIPEGMMNAIASERQPFHPFGAGDSVAPLCLRSADFESEPGEWTELELVCFEDKSLHIVNGRVVMVLRDSRRVDDGRAAPLTRGKLQLQCEGAEVFFKDIEIRSIDALPAEFAKFFE